jgi:hypothetical protein
MAAMLTPIRRTPAELEDEAAEAEKAKTPHPLELVVAQLKLDLERVNQTLITRNDQLDAAKAIAEREVFKDVVVLAAMLDAKAYISSRGGMEGALIIQRITNVETRLGNQALNAAVVLQKVKSLSEAQRAGREVFPEELVELLKNGEKLL